MPSSPDALAFSLPLNTAAVPVVVPPGGSIILRGSFHSSRDGSIIDAATTTWPAEAPGGASVDSGGLIDFEAGGFHVVSRDPKTHEVQAIANEIHSTQDAPACALANVQAPCLPLRLEQQAISRLMTGREWSQSLVGGIQVEVPAAPIYAPAMPLLTRLVPAAEVAAGVLVAAAIGALLWKRYRSWRQSAPVQLARLARQVRDQAIRADPILAAPLTPALESALHAVREQRVDPASDEGKRVAELLRRVSSRLDETAAKERADDERRAADELVHQIEIALEAAGEASELGPKRR